VRACAFAQRLVRASSLLTLRRNTAAVLDALAVAQDALVKAKNALNGKCVPQR
jgi:hypothetical protein